LAFYLLRRRCQREQHEKIDDGDHRIDFERAIGRGGDDRAFVQEIGDCNRRDQRSILQLDDRLVHKGRDHSLDRLWQDDVAHDLAPAHADRARRIPLPPFDRVNAAADDLGVKGAGIERQHQCRRNMSRDVDTKDDRQRLIEPHDLHSSGVQRKIST
jgi:hypothetical protein